MLNTPADRTGGPMTGRGPEPCLLAPEAPS